MIGEGSRVMFDYPYNHVLDPENSDTLRVGIRGLRLLLGDSTSEIKAIRVEYTHQF